MAVGEKLRNISNSEWLLRYRDGEGATKVTTFEVYLHAREVGGSTVQKTRLDCNWGNLHLPPGLYGLTATNDSYAEPAERMPRGARRVRLENRLWVP